MKNLNLLLVVLFIFSGCTGSGKNLEEAEKYFQKSKECMQKKDTQGIIYNVEKAIELGILKNEYGNESVYGVLASAYLLKKDKLKAKKYYKLSLGEAYKTLDYLKDKNRTDLIA